jgi:hypothetical protein
MPSRASRGRRSQALSPRQAFLYACKKDWEAIVDDHQDLWDEALEYLRGPGGNSVAGLRRLLKKIRSSRLNINYQSRINEEYDMLHLATRFRNPKIVRFLVQDLGASIYQRTTNGGTALMVAALNGDTSSVRLFLDHPSCDLDFIKAKALLTTYGEPKTRPTEPLTAESWAELNGFHEVAGLIRDRRVELES